MMRQSIHYNKDYKLNVMIKHIVLFGLDDTMPGNKKAHLTEIKKRLEALTQEIDALKGMQVKFNVNPAEKYDFMLIADVEDMDALGVYAGHPSHVSIVKELIAPYKVSRACVDYEY